MLSTNDNTTNGICITQPVKKLLLSIKRNDIDKDRMEKQKVTHTHT